MGAGPLRTRRRLPPGDGHPSGPLYRAYPRGAPRNKDPTEVEVGAGTEVEMGVEIGEGLEVERGTKRGIELGEVKGVVTKKNQCPATPSPPRQCPGDLIHVLEQPAPHPDAPQRNDHRRGVQRDHESVTVWDCAPPSQPQFGTVHRRVSHGLGLCTAESATVWNCAPPSQPQFGTVHRRVSHCLGRCTWSRTALTKTTNCQRGTNRYNDRRD